MKIKLGIALLAILFAGQLYAVNCVYSPKDTKDKPSLGYAPQGNCGKLVGDKLTINAASLKKIDFSNDGLAWIIADGKVFYVTSAGKTVRVFPFDNGADYFHDGLARTISNGKIGFINKALDIVIKPQYDFTFPFENGVAIVCNGCYIKKEVEHGSVIDGKWGMINKAGKVLIPIKYSRAELKQQAAYKNLER